MTFADLLHKASFDEIIPYLEKHSYGKKKKQIALFKTHFDLLKQLEPCEKISNRKIFISKELVANEGIYYWPQNLCALHWNENLAKELVFKAGVRQVWGEIIACCLLHTSIYGYTPEMMKEDFARRKAKSIYSFYYKRAKKIHKKIEKQGGNFPSETIIWKLPDFKDQVDGLVHLNYNNPYVENSSDKNKLEKYYNDLIYYVRMYEIGKIVCDVIPSEKIEGSISPQTLFKLFSSNKYETYRYLSYADTLEDRGKWLWELATKYEAFYKGILSNVVICFAMSHDYPAAYNDTYYFNEIIAWLRQRLHNINVIWGVNYDDELGNQLRLSAIFYE